MKYFDASDEKKIPGRSIGPGERFNFHCHAGLACFNQCCRNLNLLLYPYDVLRLRRHLKITSDKFIDHYVDIVLRPGHHFPEVLLRMSDQPGQPCCFSTAQGCRVYEDRPHTCRLFPVEQGARMEAVEGYATPVYFFRPPEFCQGSSEDFAQTIDEYLKDQEAEEYYPLTLAWAQLRRLFATDPWGLEGPQGAKAKMAFMAAYNIDRFREFVFQSSFLKRYHVAPATVKKVKRSDEALLKFGFEWIRVFVWGQSSKEIRVRR
ncbi:MAG: YkgJ family cysteine cluster protein [Desulfobacteraceae bacterium]|nr:YkgJ family cysteine cluster protein [Desulfobacteraceae bacterium]